MISNRIERVQELFKSALSLPPDQRSAFLLESTGDDIELRAEVESLLKHDTHAGEGFMRVPPRERSTRSTLGFGASGFGETTADDEDLHPKPPEIEGYEIEEELSRGGQGIVYRAIQKFTKRRVAIKVLLETANASPLGRRRFEREIEMVAQLTHPNIISIFHSGRMADRRQFYVMDYVEGRPLDKYVRESSLTLEATLELFATVCDAVQYAHRKGILHRDLKPSNILVDASGVPRILDFGLAKPLTADAETVMSIGQQIVGTLQYMSPEQAGGNAREIDTRTDVYSLGVILYELLTGHHPYTLQGSIPHVLRQISETPPTPPISNWTRDAGVTQRSTRKLRRGECPIDGEVETVLCKAIAKERERRYQSAGELARDIRHYLAGEPIEARAESIGYMLWKQSRRFARQAPLATLSLLCALLAPGLIISVVFWSRAAGERDTAHAVVQFLNEDVFGALDPARSGRDVDLTLLLDSASQQIGETFGGAPSAEASIRHTLGNFYHSLGEEDRALAHLERALELRRGEFGERSLAVAETIASRALVLESLGRVDEAETDLNKALQIRTALLGPNDPLVVATTQQLAAFAGRRGNLELEAILTAQAGAGEARSAEPTTTAPAALTRQAAEQALSEARSRHGYSHPAVAEHLVNLADVLANDGEYARSESLYAEALNILSDQFGTESLRSREAYRKLERLFERWGRPEKAVPYLVERLDRVLREPDNARLLSDAAWDVVKSPQHYAELYQKALDAAQRASALQPANGAFLNTLGIAQYRCGLYAAARDTLIQSDKLNDGHPADVAFVAMASHRLDDADMARRQLERLQNMASQAPWSTDVQSMRFLDEAASVLRGD